MEDQVSEPRHEELLDALIGAADRGPEVPAGAPERLKNALRPEWRRQVRRRTLRRSAAIATGLAAAAALVIVALPPAEPAPSLPRSAGTIEVVLGGLRVARHGEPERLLRSLDGGRMLLEGSRLTTREEQRVAIRMAGGASLRLDQNSAIELGRSDEIRLLAGGVYVDAAAGDRPTVVRTPLGVTRDIGTQFEVRLESRMLRVRVREGTVVVDRGRGHRRLTAGSELTVDAGAERTSDLAPDDPVWGWVQAVAPRIDIEGRSVADFAIRASRESGVPVRYADAEAGRIASASILHGAVEGLPPLEALEAVLPTAGLEARRDAGVLVIGRAGSLGRSPSARPATRR